MPGAHAPRAPGIAMWAAIAVAAVAAAVLIAFTRDPNTWRFAAGFLVLSCLAVCVWSAVIGARSEREVNRAVRTLIDNRQARATPKRDSHDR